MPSNAGSNVAVLSLTASVLGTNVQRIVPHRIGNFIEELCHLLVRLLLHLAQNLLNQVRLVPPAGFHDQLAG